MRMECGMAGVVAVLGLAMLMAGVPARAVAQDTGGAAVKSEAEQRACAFIAEYEKTIRPLEIAENRTSWNAQASGKDEDYKADEEAQNKVDAALADPKQFAVLRQLREELKADAKADPLVARQIELLYLEYLGRQVDPELLKKINAKSTAIMQAFNVYRPEVDGKKLAESEVDQILKENRDSQYRRRVWEGSKDVGKVVEKDLKELVALRNEAARKLGFEDFYDMELQRGEMTRAQVLKLFDELHELTAGLFREAKGRIDAKLAADFGIRVAELQPWHYHDRFFQESPDAYGVNFDTFYKNADVVKLAGKFYDGIGLNVDDVIARSDLYERPGKYPHAQCFDIDRVQDIRVMANAVPNAMWMGTMLHELGHATYDKYIPASLPYVVHDAAHTFTTEAVAMLFERLALQPAWMQSMGLTVNDPAAVAKAQVRAQSDAKLIFEAWAQVMVRFESAMYAHPDQDLNKLWWDLVAKYQLVQRPEGRNAPDYASKIHIVTTPAYYHSYMIGELFVSQMQSTLRRDVLKAAEMTPLFTGRKEVGDYMKTKVFAPGARMKWDAFVRYATGEELSPRAMMEELKAAQRE